MKAKLSLTQRTYRCERCGLVVDRDVNAAINLASPVEAVGTASGAGTGWNPVLANAQGEERFMTRPDKTATADRARVSEGSDANG